jgi:hypothetical protein
MEVRELSFACIVYIGKPIPAMCSGAQRIAASTCCVNAESRKKATNLG